MKQFRCGLLFYSSITIPALSLSNRNTVSDICRLKFQEPWINALLTRRNLSWRTFSSTQRRSGKRQCQKTNKEESDSEAYLSFPWGGIEKDWRRATEKGGCIYGTMHMHPDETVSVLLAFAPAVLTSFSQSPNSTVACGGIESNQMTSTICFNSCWSGRTVPCSPKRNRDECEHSTGQLSSGLISVKCGSVKWLVDW